LFKLVGPKLTAYHEVTRQPRATINLAKASRLIDDKSSLTKKEISTKGGGRRKSAFAEEEDGYMFVEEGFRIRFANGEVIDFYADSAAEKGEWMKVLSDVVGRPNSSSQSKPWVDMILKRNGSTVVAPNHARRGAPAGSPTKGSKEQMQHQMALREGARKRAEEAKALETKTLEDEEAKRTAAAAAAAAATAAVPTPTPAPAPIHTPAPAPAVAETEQSPSRRSGIPVRLSSPEKFATGRYGQQLQQQQGQGQNAGLAIPPRFGHQRTESHPQPGSRTMMGSVARSQPSSPVKNKVGKEARYQKARSIIGMQWH
jgi:hypothetical protein